MFLRMNGFDFFGMLSFAVGLMIACFDYEIDGSISDLSLVMCIVLVIIGSFLIMKGIESSDIST